ncbi:MAG: hypothetical protein HUU50_18770 [Candidatus Brocadiae bacterium]|nr:hypothetical protein [Candidatus Brocadiia bacterium]
MDQTFNFLEIERYGHCTIGRIAIDQGLITAKQLMESLKKQHEKPSQKMGEIWIENGFATPFQVEELSEFQKRILQGVTHWEAIPDTIIQGFVRFKNLVLDELISLDQLKDAERARERELRGEGAKLLQEILFSEFSPQQQEKFSKIQSEIQLFYRQCPCCQRIYRLFDFYPILTTIPCPVCWHSQIVPYQKNGYHGLPSCETKKMEILVPHESPEFLEIYEILKKMDPLREVGKTWKWSKDHLTVRRLFSEMTKKLVREELQDSRIDDEKQDTPQEKAVQVTRQINKSSLPIMATDEAKPNPAIQPDPSSLILKEGYTIVPLVCDHTQTPTLSKSLVRKKIIRQKVIQTRRVRRKPNYLWLLFAFVGIFIVVYSMSQDESEMQEDIPTKSVMPSDPQKNIGVNPKDLLAAQTKENLIQAPALVNTEEPKKVYQQNLTPLGVDLLVVENLHRLLPAFSEYGKMLRENCQDFLTKQDTKEYKMKHEKWLRLFEYQIKQRLAPLDVPYQSSDNQEKAEKLHRLAGNIEKTAMAIMTYLETKQGAIAEKSFKDLAVAANANACIVLADELLTELSGKKYNLWLD